MANRPARLENTEVLRRFRRDLLTFHTSANQALTQLSTDVHRTLDWLKNTQRPHWKRELRKRQEQLTHAEGEYMRALASVKVKTKSSCLDQQLAVKKAKRRRQEAEDKIESVARWTVALEQRIEKLMQPCTALSIRLHNTVPRAVDRLDRMSVSLDEYLRPPPPSQD